MNPDSCFADFEPSRDLLVRVTGEEATQDFAFATRDVARSPGVGGGRAGAGARRTEASVPMSIERDERDRATQIASRKASSGYPFCATKT